MNYFKHSPLPKLAANRVRKQNARNPNLIPRRKNTRLENMDIMDVYAARASLQAQKEHRWRGGDEQDRLEYIEAQKARLGSNIDRVLMRSSKRMPSGHYLKDEVPYLEFNDVIRVRDMPDGYLQPGDMAWSISEFVKRIDELSVISATRSYEVVKQAREEFEEALAGLEKEFGFEAKELDEEQRVARIKRIYEKVVQAGGGYSKMEVQRGIKLLKEMREETVATKGKQ